MKKKKVLIQEPRSLDSWFTFHGWRWRLRWEGNLQHFLFAFEKLWKIDFTWFLSLKLSQLKFIYTHITVWPLSQLISLDYWLIKFRDETITKTHLKRFHTTCNAEKLLKIMSTSQTIEEKSSTNLWYFRLDLEVIFSDLLPETKTQDGMRTNSKEGCRPSFVKSNNSFGFENFEGTVIYSRVHLTNSTSVNGLIV